MNKNNLIKYEPKYYSPLISDYVQPISNKEIEWYKLNQKLKEDLNVKPRIWKQDFSEIERIKNNE